MTEALSNPALLRLLSWMSPSFPVGAYAYSHGLERAVHDGMVANAGQLEDWLCDLVTVGSAWNDAVLFAESWRRAADDGQLDELAELAEALAGSSERHLETVKQGDAFLEAAAAWPSPVLGRLGRQCPLPVAVGALASAHDIPLAAALTAYLHAFTANLVQAGLRLMALGQKDGIQVLAALEATIVRTADRAAGTTLDDLGGATILAEIAAMNHETQYSRIFRS
ncbi:urease accessory protein UreF [Hoeflea poritis]|uniref:Urease accessory protein UreF n=1 Tax=Hoeflea poritis TaxID=2993659 RepID=A0ABT4VRB9_9HYPH|nr:urease accessory protein UreF [Hoeflea poritis]MDA4847262.1 urease accessory protein UreF [Hoeflea poritis]